MMSQYQDLVNEIKLRYQDLKIKIWVIEIEIWYNRHSEQHSPLSCILLFAWTNTMNSDAMGRHYYRKNSSDR